MKKRNKSCYSRRLRKLQGGYVYGKNKKDTKKKHSNSSYYKHSHHKRSHHKHSHSKKKHSRHKHSHSKKKHSMSDTSEKARGNTASVTTHNAHNKTALLDEIRNLISQNKDEPDSMTLSQYDTQLKKIRFLIKNDIIQMGYAMHILQLLNEWKAKSDVAKEVVSPRAKSDANKKAENAWHTLMNKDGWSAFSDAINIEGDSKPTLLRQESDM